MSVIFLFSGQSRTFPFSHNPNVSQTEILNSYNKYIFTDKFKSQYKYKIYISTDDLHLENTINYFQLDNIGNIHLYDTNFYLKNIKNLIKTIEHYQNKYNENDWSYYYKYDNSIQQHYKLLDCYNLFIDDKNNVGNVNYIIRLRMDIAFTSDLVEMLDFFIKNQQLEILFNWDFFSIGKTEIMKDYCTGLDYNYGKFNYLLFLPQLDFFPDFVEWDKLNKQVWTFAPEIQLFLILFDYCKKNNLNFNNISKELHVSHIVRKV